VYPFRPLRPQSQGSLMTTEPRADFSSQEIERYSRNTLLTQVGWEGQTRWRASRVLVVGAGGIGSAALLYLAAAGVGCLGLADSDAVALSNLQRQILYHSADLGRQKAAVAEESLAALNAHCRVETFDQRLNPINVQEVLHGFEVVLDASDNFPTRFLLAECCWLNRVPLVSAAATGWYGKLLVALPGAENPCYRCLVPEMPSAEAVPSSSESGILGAVAGTMGCLQAVEALKLLLGRESGLTRQLLAYDGLAGRFQSLARAKRPDCPLCGNILNSELSES
jgi:molybdopterin/thiamine biosynthesis adenylyltransferase